jgi:ribonuclease BN (tRNA processing enzyme)
MKIHFIGTSSAKTSLKRFHSSIVIKEKDFTLLLDAGEAITKALLHQYVYFNSINAILISHLHPDHSSGLPALITQMHLDKREEPLFIYSSINNIEKLKDLLYQSYLFQSRLSFQINFVAFEEGISFSVDEKISLMGKRNTHLDKYILNDVNKQLSFESTSFLITFANHKIHYTADIGGIDDLYLFKSELPTLLITEISHISFEDVLTVAQNPFPHKILLTHYSDEDKQNLDDFLQKLPEELDDKIVLAEDGLLLNLSS